MKYITQPEEINYLESTENYTLVFYQNGEKVLHNYTLKKFEIQFAELKYFRRIHKKYLVNQNFVHSQHNFSIQLIRGKTLPIARIRRVPNL